MKNTRKIKTLIIILLFITSILSTNVFAVSEISSQATDFINTGKNHTNITMDTSKIKDASDNIYNIFFGVGVAAAVIVGAILGIQFMTAGIDKKVEVKKSLFPYIVSCIVIFGSFGIWKLTVTIIKEINPSPDTTIITTQSSDESTIQQSGDGSTTHQSSSGQTHVGGGIDF